MIAVFAAMAMGGCASGRLQLRSTPHQKYAAALDRAGLGNTAIARQWQAAGQSALTAALLVPTPFRESGYFPPDAPTATAYRLELTRGRRLTVEVTFETIGSSRLFVDLFEVTAAAGFRPVASLEADESALLYDIERTATFVLRVQPELLQSGRYTLTERTLASLPFPVPGLTARGVQSLFGSPRDDGAREHEGVDIFAPRGTAVVAVSGGVARTDTNALGGNVVWLGGGFGGRRYYYAHLDRWAIDGMARVEAGDVLGYVGNTGNARTTSPHLHFGIYDGGALDPWPFLRPDDPLPAATDDDTILGEQVRITVARAPLREAPIATGAERRLLERESLGLVLGVSGIWRRLVLPDGTSGFVASTALARSTGPLRRTVLRSGTALHEWPDLGTPVVASVNAGDRVEVMGRSGEYMLLRDSSGSKGWTRPLQ